VCVNVNERMREREKLVEKGRREGIGKMEM
jgi:hypothetical protein